MIDPNLVALLQAKGFWNADGIARAARMGRCESCRAEVLRGLDGDRAAMTATCDPHEIDLRGEVIAILLDLRTYSLTRRGSAKGIQWMLDHRDRWAVAANHSQNTQRLAIVAEHRCGVAVPPAARTFLPAATHLPLPDDQAPF